jgi:tellurite resistance protein TerC
MEQNMELLGAWWMWIGFGRHRHPAVAGRSAVGGRRQATQGQPEGGSRLVTDWIGVALLFNGAIWWYLDANAGRELANRRRWNFSPAT